MKLTLPVVLLALVTGLWFPTSASGAAGTSRPFRATTTDTTSDVVAYRGDGGGDGPGENLGTQPDHTNGDLHVVRVTHGKKAVRLDATFRDLARAGSELTVELLVRRPAAQGDDIIVLLTATPGAWRGKATLYGFPTAVDGTTPRASAAAACAMTWKINYTANTVALVVPRSCLGNPRWIRAGVGSAQQYGDKRFVDDGLSAKPLGAKPLTLGPKLYS